MTEKEFIANLVQTNSQNRVDDVKKETLAIANSRRKVYASISERKMMENGQNIYFRTSGNNNEILKIEFALMSDALVFQLVNKQKLLDEHKSLGFKRVYFEDGFSFSKYYEL